MKRWSFFLLIFSSIIGYGQKDIVNYLQDNYKSSPTNTIIYVDSLLVRNRNYNKKFIAEIKYYQASAYQENNNHKKALEIFREILPFFKGNENKTIKILLYQSDSNVRLNNFVDATNQALEALDLAKTHQFNKEIVSANNALSFIYYSNKDYLKAFDYLFNTVDLSIKEKDSVRLSATYNNIAIIYKSMGNIKQALAYNEKSLDISFLLKDKEGIGKSYSNIGRVYELFGKYDKALIYYGKAIKNNRESKISNSIPYANIGEVYLLKKEYKKAIDNFLKAVEIEKINKNQNVLQNIYSSLLKTSITNKDFEQALIYQAKFDSVYNINIKKQNEEKIKVLKNQHKLFQSKKEIEQYKSISFKNKIIFGILSGLLILLGLYWYQSTRNKVLKNEKEKLYLEQMVLRSQMNPHFIFNALSAIQNSLLDNDTIKSATYLSRFAKLIRQNFDFINQKTILLVEEIDALKNYLDTQKLRFQDKFDYEINVFADVDINIVEIPPLLIQPFIENAIEHGFKNSKIKGKIILNISRDGNRICYEIKDNGNGKNPSVKSDGKIHSTDIFKKRIKLLGKKDEDSFVIESLEKGTTIRFCLTNS